MAEAAAATRWAEVTVAEQEALTSAGRCQPGDVLGVVEGEVVVIGADLAAVACDLLDRMLSAGGELVTLVRGAPTPALGDAVAGHLARRCPDRRGGPLRRRAAGRGPAAGRGGVTDGASTLDTGLVRCSAAKTAKVMASSSACSTVRDLLRHYPRRYAERGELTDLADLQVGDEVDGARRGALGEHAARCGSAAGMLTEVVVGDGAGQR